MKSLLTALCAWIICGALLFVFATNIALLWALWLISLGILVGKALSFEPRLPEAVAGTIALSILATIIVRALPIYSLGWEGVSRLTITELGQNWQIEITDPAEVETFKTYAKRGHYETMQKSGYGYHVYAGDTNTLIGYYVHGDCLGRQPGAAVQSVFVPQKNGFRQLFEGVLKKHGHELR